MFVVDVLRYDVEALPNILNLLNSQSSVGWRFAWPHDFDRDEVTQALSELVKQGMVQPLLKDEQLGELADVTEPLDVRSNISHLWFRLTKKGWETWEYWSPPVEPDEDT